MSRPDPTQTFARLIAALSIIAAIVWGIHFWWENRPSLDVTTEENANSAAALFAVPDTWTTYEHATAGFTIDVPSDYTITNETGDGVYLSNSTGCIELSEGLLGDQLPGCFFPSLVVRDSALELTPSTAEGSITSHLGAFDATTTYNATDVPNMMAIQADINGTWYVLYASFNISDRDTAEEILNAMATTFSLAGSSGNDTASSYYPTDWQAYAIVPTTEGDAHVSYPATDGTTNVLTPPIDEPYRFTVTPYGTLFWRIGETQDFISASGFTFSFPTSVDPEAVFFSLSTGDWITLPTVDLVQGDTAFEMIYDVIFSSTEPKLILAIGSYDTTSGAFEPGLIESQPTALHGMVYDIGQNAFEDGDPLTTYLAALEHTTTAFIGMAWDSARAVAVSAPGGEGCGAYDRLDYVFLDTSIRVQVGGQGSMTFVDSTCNPRNGVSPDHQWFVLFGENENGTIDMYLFTTASTDPIKQRLHVDPEDVPSFIYESWDTSGDYPIVDGFDFSDADTPT